MQTTFGPRHFRTTDLPTDKLIRFTLNFPQYAEYIEECYSRGIYTTQSTTAWAPLGNYLSAPTLLFLFTNAPSEDMALELTSKNYFLTSLMTAFYQPCNLTLNPLNLPTVYTNLSAETPLSSSVTSLLPQISSLWGDLHKSVLSRNDGKIFEIMVPYTEELIWFEIYSSVACGRHTLDFKETPSVKLYYPEPFVATPSFVHEDVWFLHILLYAHWLWFFFISLIILFFITFINTVRWCNYRVRPKRETRGVSRSKCADLITACVPVSWAISIIISESTDAVDYYDGFGTGELILGIRAYQWGWQYYYPKGIDLAYSVTPTYSSFMGKSLYSSTSTSSNTTANKLWQHYQSADLNNFSTSSTSTLLSPALNSRVLKFVDTNTIGTNSLKATDSFKRIQQFSKTNNSNLFTNSSDIGSRYLKIKSLYLGSSSTNNSLTYGTSSQQNYTSQLSTQPNSHTYLESEAFKAYWGYNVSSSDSRYTLDPKSPLSRTNARLNLKPAITRVSYFPSPTTYVDYDLTSYKHARQVESLFWESKSNLLHNRVSKKKILTPLYEDYYASLRRTTKGGSTVQVGTKNLLLPKGSITNQNNFFNNPSLITTNDYSLFFPKAFTSKWKLEYLTKKGEGTFIKSGGTHTLNSNLNMLVPSSTANVLDSYPSVTNSKRYFSDEVTSRLTTKFSAEALKPEGLHLRSSNPFHIRSSANESLTTYNALRKVFKARFDENRSNIRLANISGLGMPAPLINMPKVSFENLLTKNSTSFLSKLTYKPSTTSVFSSYWTLDSLLNFYASDLPFLKSLKSDASRYIWFDWGSRWERIEVQPSSIARYSLLGVPYSRNKFAYSSWDAPKTLKLTNSSMLESENYFARLGRSRKNYITTWAYSPYIYSRLTSTNTNYSAKGPELLSSGWRTLKCTLRSVRATWLNTPVSQINSAGGSIASTPLNVPGRAFTEPLTGMGNYSHLITKTASILSKRENFYRHYLASKGYSFFTHPDITSSPQNPLLNLLKSNFELVDPNLLGIEGNRTFASHYPDSFTKLTPSLLGYKQPSELLLTKLNYVEDFTATNLQKNQYRPMRKGITNMVRLHATGAVAIPTEIRTHILASSKDVIHSWAIPSAGIKIDCIPGYSSHRVVIFFNSGIYWGQCMEICGRFHHWMPIVLYIMKRDTFFIWTTHFIHYNKQTSSFTGTANGNTLLSGPISKTKPFYNYNLKYPKL